ncbi:TIGR03960 family B12-binding radical SAM protein [Dissulfurimicrobium hydrothermale]|uniref:TIGR03960 family B12-binding radical SAM protein n=1 Tax=Dissulfurimicrobium hydrothermale TaxID=1750598 RepID=UPI001EDAF01E|nr:TIGR03960 family B12-binding radical SAM protein [Dissulfurimicrobium hydrothermale]UKL14539.1 TIGR03960 family B12-binding radical SAM protein [Dissulfurimicrobium hydrothermale]
MKITNIYDILPLIKKPGRYLGNEVNARRKAWDEASVRIALIFPDLYEIGMSHLGLQILYHILNDTPWALADRAYCPDRDMEKNLREKGLQLFGIESKRPLRAFDILGITLPYELCYINIITILECAKIPLLAKNRDDPDWPVVIGGGSCAVNPEPIAGIFDAILIGDGEEAVIEMASTVRSWKEAKGTKRELLSALCHIDGVYVPGFYRAIYNKTDGVFCAIEPTGPAGLPISRRIVSDLSNAGFPKRPILPHTQIVHDRLGVEIARGCTRGCRFCQAGIIYRPVRERTPEQLMDIFESGLKTTGWEEISLLSLSTGDYGCLGPLLCTLMERFTQENVSVSMPSLRVGTLTPEMMAQIRRVRKTGFTLAPEAGSERLRRVINKGITEKDVLETASQVYAMGWNGIKLYFMIGLPTETIEDVLAISELAKKVLAHAIKGRQGLTVSVGTFVPKPHTPFQWERQITTDESWERIRLLKTKIRGHGLKLKWHDPRQSLLEGIFARGDRRLLHVLLKAWRLGARLDAWRNHLRADLYYEAANEEGIDLSSYLNTIEIGRVLPWGHIQTGVRMDYLLNERELAFKEAYTLDCRSGACYGCGVCNFKEIRPILFKKCSLSPEKSDDAEKAKRCTGGRYFYNIAFIQMGNARFIGHLDLSHTIHRAARRAGLPLLYSHGHHPMPHISFGPPIPLGMESLWETMIIGLTEPIEESDVFQALEREMPDGITLTSIKLTTSPRIHYTDEKTAYLIYLPGLDTEQCKRAIDRFMKAGSWPAMRHKKGIETVLDLRKAVKSLHILMPDKFENDQAIHPWISSLAEETKNNDIKQAFLGLEMQRINGPQPRPSEIAAALFGLTDGEVLKLRILKLAPNNGL